MTKPRPIPPRKQWRTLIPDCEDFCSDAFTYQEFLNLPIINGAFSRLPNRRVLIGRDQPIVDRVEDYKIELRSGRTVELYDIANCYYEAILSGVDVADETVFLEELIDSRQKVNFLIKVGYFFKFLPPGEDQYLASSLRNHHGTINCLLFKGWFRKIGIRERFVLYPEPPQLRTLVLGPSMYPLARYFDVKGEKNLMEIKDAVFGSTRRDGMRFFKKRAPWMEGNEPLAAMSEFVFMQHPMEGEYEFKPGEKQFEMLNVRRDANFPSRFSGAASPFFTVVDLLEFHADRKSYTVVEFRGDEKIKHRIGFSECLLFPLGTSTRLGERLGEEIVVEKGEPMGRAVKYKGDMWKGLAELIDVDDREQSFIRPILIRNIHDGILAEFVFIDEMELGSHLLPLCNPYLVPTGYSRSNRLRVQMDLNGVNELLIEQIWNEDRRAVVAPRETLNFQLRSVKREFDWENEDSVEKEAQIVPSCFDVRAILSDVNGNGNGSMNGIGEEKRKENHVMEEAMKENEMMIREEMEEKDNSLLRNETTVKEEKDDSRLRKDTMVKEEKLADNCESPVDGKGNGGLTKYDTDTAFGNIMEKYRKKNERKMSKPTSSSSSFINQVENEEEEVKIVEESIEKNGVDAEETRNGHKEDDKEIPAKRVRLDEGKKIEKKEEIPRIREGLKRKGGRGIPLDSSFNPTALPPQIQRAIAARESVGQRGGIHRIPPSSFRFPIIDEKYISKTSGMEERKRIAMEETLVRLDLYKAHEKFPDYEFLTPEIMRNFRPIRDWNNDEVLLFISNFDINAELIEDVRKTDQTGFTFLSLSSNDLDKSFTNLGAKDFDEKTYLSGFIRHMNMISQKLAFFV